MGLSKIIATSFLYVLFLLASSNVHAATNHGQHVHCGAAFYATSAAPTQTLPIKDEDTGNQLNFDFSSPAIPTLPGCVYEVSDIVEVEITLFFTGTLTWDEMLVGIGSVSGASAIQRAPLPYFYSGIFQLFTFDGHAFAFNPHVDMVLPLAGGASIGVDLVGEVGDFELTAAFATVRGFHYYLPIPEPGSLPLVVIGLLAISALWRRRS